MTNPDDMHSTQVIPTQSDAGGAASSSTNGREARDRSARQRGRKAVADKLSRVAGGGSPTEDKTQAQPVVAAGRDDSRDAQLRSASQRHQPGQQFQVKPVKPPKQGRLPKAPRARRARLSAIRVDPWSVMKTAFMLSVACGIMVMACVLVVWNVLNASGVFDSINSTVADILGSSSRTKFDVMNYVGFQKVAGFTALICVVDVVLITALATLGSFLYNLSASLLGGIEVTLAEDD